jgi:hypothetical protein
MMRTLACVTKRGGNEPIASPPDVSPHTHRRRVQVQSHLTNGGDGFANPAALYGGWTAEVTHPLDGNIPTRTSAVPRLLFFHWPRFPFFATRCVRLCGSCGRSDCVEGVGKQTSVGRSVAAKISASVGKSGKCGALGDSQQRTNKQFKRRRKRKRGDRKRWRACVGVGEGLTRETEGGR